MNNKAEVLLDTDSGKLRGQNHAGLLSFHAIPYATPPIGKLRFSPPLPPTPWGGVRDAQERGPIAPQVSSRLSLAMGDFDLPQDEDCLTLTVRTPGVDDQRRPVVVWFHGGGYISGAGALSWYDGSRLASEGDIVVVNVNYRIGALGYLYAPGISPGNLGLLDQQAALEWVQQHIASFGGDPDQVTVMGQSAGSHSIALLLTRPDFRPSLAHRAILQSAPLGLTLYDPDKAECIGEVFLKALGINPTDSQAREHACQVSTKAILDAQAAAFRHVIQQAGPGDPVALPFIPIADGAILPESQQMTAALKKAATKLDVLIGTTREEANVFFYQHPAIQALTHPPIPAHEVARLSAQRPGASAAQLLMDFAGEQLFLQPTLDWAVHAAQAGRRVHLYQFDWASPNQELAATHCLELPFVFGTRTAFADAPMMAGANMQQVDALSAMMRASWISFIRNGDPNHAGVPPWPLFEPTRRGTMRFDVISGAVGDLAGKTWHPSLTT
ncbi:carboxylesterase/lipase family protein [Undibacterium arcticum]|uniref:Carboxylic ester hydrolase n=1 Tax=Undibacterium arcticum TaxID=1762892 RepID=A0ABV7EZ12_9BURK